MTTAMTSPLATLAVAALTWMLATTATDSGDPGEAAQKAAAGDGGSTPNNGPVLGDTPRPIVQGDDGVGAIERTRTVAGTASARQGSGMGAGPTAGAPASPPRHDGWQAHGWHDLGSPDTSARAGPRLLPLIVAGNDDPIAGLLLSGAMPAAEVLIVVRLAEPSGTTDIREILLTGLTADAFGMLVLPLTAPRPGQSVSVQAWTRDAAGWTASNTLFGGR